MQNWLQKQNLLRKIIDRRKKIVKLKKYEIYFYKSNIISIKIYLYLTVSIKNL